MASRHGEKCTTDVEIADKVQSILASKGLSLYQVSQQSAVIFGKASPYFLPHNFYSGLRRDSFLPSIFQIFALSRISTYRILDWLRVFRVDLENIPRLQALLPRKRTALIDISLIDNQVWIPWKFNAEKPR